MASGLGTPIGNGLPVALCGGSLTYTVTVTNPGKQESTVDKKVSLQIVATDSGGLALTYSATDLPNGLKLNVSTGLVRGTVRTAGKSSVTITATDYTGATSSVTFTWRVTA